MTLNYSMKKLLLIALLIVGCDNSTESSPKEWICIADPYIEPESPDAEMKPYTNPTFNSIEECEEACPDDSISLINTIVGQTESYSDGTGEYMIFICSEYSSNP